MPHVQSCTGFSIKMVIVDRQKYNVLNIPAM